VTNSRRTGYRGRFAPSPTGDLHFGSLIAAAGSWLRARAEHGAWIVRIEDLDPPREVPGAARRIVDALAAFGLASDEAIVHQSERGSLYAQAAARLVKTGAAFECRCSRTDLADGLHRACVARGRDFTRAAALRVRAPDTEIGFDDLLQGRRSQNLARDVGDFVVRRVEGYWAYQLAVVVDDALQGITEVVRGADLLDSTPRQIHLQHLLGYATPGYAHLPLALDAERRKLSKQLASAPVDPRDPMPALRRALAFLGIRDDAALDATRPNRALERAIEVFSLDRVPRADRAADDPDDVRAR